MGKGAYLDFIRKVRKCYSDAHIVCTLGMMKEGDNLYTTIEEAVQFYVKDTKDRHVYSLHFNPPTEDEGFASAKHPSLATQARCGRELADFIKRAVLKIQ